MQIIINAGGGGSRLWPISTDSLPKQFCKLINNQSLLEITYNRLVQDFSPDQIWVATNQKYKNIVSQELPDLPLDHILLEPAKRDTLAAVCSHSAVVASKTSVDESLVFVSADHLVTPESSVKVHNKALELIDSSLQKNQFPLVVAGIKPTHPSPQYGYIELADNYQNSFGNSQKLVTFREKPSEQIAEEFLKTGRYLWNFGLFAFKYNSLTQIIESNYPDLASVLSTIFSKEQIDLVDFEKFPKTSFDYGVLEKIDNIGVVGMDFGKWEDIGSFDVLSGYIPEVASLDETKKDLGNKIQILGKGNKARLNSEKSIAFVGVDNLLLVETEQGILVIDPRFSKEVKKVAEYFADKSKK